MRLASSLLSNFGADRRPGSRATLVTISHPVTASRMASRQAEEADFVWPRPWAGGLRWVGATGTTRGSRKTQVGQPIKSTLHPIICDNKRSHGDGEKRRAGAFVISKQPENR